MYNFLLKIVTDIFLSAVLRIARKYEAICNQPDALIWLFNEGTLYLALWTGAVFLINNQQYMLYLTLIKQNISYGCTPPSFKHL